LGRESGPLFFWLLSAKTSPRQCRADDSPSSFWGSNLMIADNALAGEVNARMRDCLKILDETVGRVQNALPEDEFDRFRKATGKVMGALVFEILNPLCEAHPELWPPELARGAHRPRND
jgi:hypothetical protein